MMNDVQARQIHHALFSGGVVCCCPFSMMVDGGMQAELFANLEVC